MNMIHARINNLLKKTKAVNRISPAMVVPFSSNKSNLPSYKTMSISMIATLLMDNNADVRLVAQKLIDTQKFNTLPQLVSREEIDRKVLDENEFMLFVGLRDLDNKKITRNAKDRAKQLRQEQDYLVNGILGPAIYAFQVMREPKSKDNDESAIRNAYEQAIEYSKIDNKKGVVLRMTLKSDANTISFQDFLRLLSVTNAQIKAELQNMPKFAPLLNVFLNTPTLVAIAQGYDAITQIPDGTVVILNRGALRIQKTNASNNNILYAQVQMELDEQKAKEQEKIKKEEEREKKQRERELAKAKIVEEPELQKVKSYDLWRFDNSVVESIKSNNSLTVSEKNEILSFISLYNASGEEEKYTLSQQLKEMIYS